MQLPTAVGVRDQAPAAIPETADIRNRAYTLFFDACDRVRRALTFSRLYCPGRSSGPA